MLETEILKGGNDVIDRISTEWIDLCKEGASNQPFLRPEWFGAFVRNFENEIELITVRRDGKLRAVLPLVKKRSNLHGIPFRKIQAVFNLNTQRFDLAHGADESERNEIIKAIWTVIKNRKNWDSVEVRLVKKDSWLGDLLNLAEKESYRTGIWQMDSAPFITLPPGDDKEALLHDFFRGSRKHLKQELNRRLRRLKELGDVEFVVTHGCSPELLQTFLDLEEKGWKGKGGTAVNNDPVVVRMHQEFAGELASDGILITHQLKLDDVTIAMNINIQCGDETIHWKTTYDEAYARYSPGNILFREFLSDCIKKGSPEIDFLSPSTPNKMAWATGEREHVAFYIFQRGLFGSLLHKWKFGVISGLRELKTAQSRKLVPAHAQK